MVRGSSLHNRGARRFKLIRSSWDFLTTRHMQVVDLHISTLTWILQNMNRSSATREHSTPPPCATPGGFTGCVHTTLTISRSKCIVVFSHNGIVEVLGLPEYVASTTRSQLTTVYNSMVLNWHRRNKHNRVNLSTQLSLTPVPPGLNLNIIIIMVYSWPINRVEKSEVEPISYERWNHHSTSIEV